MKSQSVIAITFIITLVVVSIANMVVYSLYFSKDFPDTYLPSIIGGLIAGTLTVVAGYFAFKEAKENNKILRTQVRYNLDKQTIQDIDDILLSVATARHILNMKSFGVPFGVKINVEDVVISKHTFFHDLINNRANIAASYITGGLNDLVEAAAQAESAVKKCAKVYNIPMSETKDLALKSGWLRMHAYNLLNYQKYGVNNHFEIEIRNFLCAPEGSTTTNFNIIFNAFNKAHEELEGIYKETKSRLERDYSDFVKEN